MFFKQFVFESKVTRLISIIISLIGLLFVFASSFIGVFSIRLVAFFLLAFSLISFDFSNLTNFNSKNLLSVTGIVSGILVIIYPWLAMFIIGVILIVYACPTLYNIFKNKDFSNIVYIVLAILSLCFGIYCIVNGTAAISTIIKLIGILLTVLGCLLFYHSIDTEQSSNKFSNEMSNYEDKMRFESAEEIKETE